MRHINQYQFLCQLDTSGVKVNLVKSYKWVGKKSIHMKENNNGMLTRLVRNSTVKGVTFVFMLGSYSLTLVFDYHYFETLWSMIPFLKCLWI